MLFANLGSVPIVKNCDLSHGLKNAASGRRHNSCQEIFYRTESRM